MGFIFSGLFWGIILILLGISVIINIVFHIHIPFFRIVIALILIYMGIRVLIGDHWRSARWSSSKTGSVAMFSDTVCNRISGEEYSVVFGRSTFDAETIFSGDSSKSSCKINTVFGSSVLIVPTSMPCVVRITAAFGSVRLPDGSIVSFGQTIYNNDASRTNPEGSAIKTIELNVVFGGSEIEER
jgi:predicted membrane protein